jgi:hypothetical protein
MNELANLNLGVLVSALHQNPQKSPRLQNQKVSMVMRSGY